MTDDSPRTDDGDGLRSKGWNKLRGKIFDKDSKLSKFKRNHDHAANSEQDVNDFLRPSTTSAATHSGPAGPKLDIPAAKGYRGAAPDDGGFLDSTSAKVNDTGGIPSYAPTHEDIVSGKWQPIKPTRRPGLQVGFADGPADVIGEGGDESEEAPLTIGQRHRQVLNQARPRPPPPPSAGRTAHADEPPIPGRLRRAPTGFSDEEGTAYQQARSPLHTNDHPTSDSPGHGTRITANRDVQASYSQPPIPGLEGDEEEEVIRPLRRAPTGFDEAREHQQRVGNDVSAELHLSSPQSSPTSRSQETSYEQQMQQILTNTYATRAFPSKDQSPGYRIPRKPSVTQQEQTLQALEGGHAHPSRPSLRMHSKSPNRTARQGDFKTDPLAPEIRSPVDSGSMRKMRAEEGLVHRNSVQGTHSGSRTESGTAEAPGKASLGLDAPLPYSAQARSSFDSIKSGGSEQSRHSRSPEPTSLVQNPRLSTASIEGAQYLSPPPSSHGAPQRNDIMGQRYSLGSQESLPANSDDRHSPGESPSAQRRGRGSSQSSVERPAPLNVQTSPARQPTSGRSVPAKNLATEEAYTHFASATSGTASLFRLTAENAGVQLTLYDWMRCALWWFLKGREGIDELVKMKLSQRQDTAGQTGSTNTQSLRQHHVNLAKSYWMLSEVIPHLLNNAPSNAQTSPTSQSVSSVDAACSALNKSFKSLCLSMRRHNILPPPQDEFVEGVDASIWLSQSFGKLPPDWQWVLSGKVFAPTRHAPDVEPLAAIPVQDNASMYCYGRVFVSATVALEDDKSLMEPFECVLSFVRATSSAEAEIIISSQSHDVNVHIRAAGEHGIHWEHTKFNHEERSLRIKLPQKLRLKLLCSQRDYSYLWNFFDNSQRVSQSLLPRRNERLLQGMRLRSFHFRDSLHPDDFPSDPVGICRAALFEQVIKSERNPRRAHAGYRFAVVNLEKTVRNVNISFGKSAPFEYSISGSQPILQFQLNEAGRRRSAHILFQEPQQRDMFRDLVSGTVLGNNESILCQISLSNVALTRAAASNLAPVVLKWSGLQVIDEDDPADPQHLSSSADASENLRVMMYNRTGSVVDRMNDAVTEFKIRLEAAYPEQLQIYRGSARHDLTVSIGPDPAETNELRQIFDVVNSGPHVSSYSFPTMQDLYKFQRAVTGFAVRYDGIASSFSIPRRKPGSLVAKHLESKEARVQIVERERVVQLIAFFHGYVLADSMNFELKRTDRFDQTDGKGSGFGIKLIDAKFVLPGSGKDDPINDGAVRDASARFTAFETENYNQERTL